MVNSSLASCSLSGITKPATDAASPSPLQTRHHQARYKRGITEPDTNAAPSKPTMHSNHSEIYLLNTLSNDATSDSNSSKLTACAIPQPAAHTTTSSTCNTHDNPLNLQHTRQPPKPAAHTTTSSICSTHDNLATGLRDFPSRLRAHAPQ